MGFWCLWGWPCVINLLLFWLWWLLLFVWCIVRIKRVVWLLFCWFLVLIHSWVWGTWLEKAWICVVFVLLWWQWWIYSSVITLLCCCRIRIILIISWVFVRCIGVNIFIFLFLNKILPLLFLVFIMQPSLIPILIQIIPIDSFQIIPQLDPILIIRHRVYWKISRRWDGKNVTLIMNHVDNILVLVFSFINKQKYYRT